MDDHKQIIMNMMKDFQYTCLVKNEFIEAWNCKRKDSYAESFDIVVTNNSIAMLGDYGDLTFNVGISYGINFLRNDSKGYVFEKLNQNSKGYELDVDYMQKEMTEWLIEHMEEQLNVESLDNDVKNAFCYILEQCDTKEITKSVSPLKLMFEILSNHYFSPEGMDELYAYKYFVSDLLDIPVEHPDEFYSVINNHNDITGDSEFWEWDVKTPSRYTRSRLWALHIAAEEIIKIKDRQ